MKQLSDKEYVLLKVQGLYFFSDSLAGIFLNLFLFKLGGLPTAVLFNMIVFAALLASYIGSGWELRRFSSRTLIRFGLLGKAATYGLLLGLREHALPFIPLLAIINGTGLGHLWSGLNLTQYNLTHQKTRAKYFGWFGSLLSLAQSVGPVIGGGIIFAATSFSFPDILGYACLFLAVVVLILVTVRSVKALPSYGKAEYSFRHIVRHRRSRNWNLVLLQQFCIGLWDVGFTTVSGVLIYLIVQGELPVGIVNTVTALLYTGVSLWAGKILTQRKRFLFVGMLGVPLGILLFALQQNWLGVLALVLANGIAAPFLNIPPFVAFFNTVDETAEPWQKKYHLLIEREVALDVPRIGTCLFLFLFFTTGDQVHLAWQWMMIVPVVPVIIGALSLCLIRPQNTKNV